jgi:hypothetical protein
MYYGNPNNWLFPYFWSNYHPRHAWNAFRLAYNQTHSFDNEDLQHAQLQLFNLSSCSFRYADLRYANLTHCSLHRSDLSYADLRNTDLSGANLSFSNLRQTNFGQARFHCTNLTGAYLNWDSHNLISSILFRAAKSSIEKRKVAGFVAISTDMCWQPSHGNPGFLDIDDPLKDWAIEVLSEYAHDDEVLPWD